jgi:hypothetical protein
MRKSFLIIMILILSCVLFLSGCKSKSNDEFLKGDETATGGIADSDAGMNVKDIDINFVQEQTEIEIHIVYGSREEVQSEAIITTLPKYEVFVLDEPYRLGVKLYGIAYVDFVQKQSWALDEHVVGVFRERIANKGYTTIYFQLKENVKFKVLEADGKIRVLLDSANGEKNESHFVMLNAFDEYLEGAVSDDYGLTPVLCADRSKISLISKPFASSDSAEAFLAELDTKVKNSVLTKKPYSLTLAGDILPIYNSQIDIMLPENKKMIIKDSVAHTLPVMFENGKFIAESDDKILYAKPYIAKDGDVSFSGEELWLLYNLDKKEKMALPAFNYIKDASFSFDGRYLGFIDIGIDNKVLYVYDFEMGELYNLGEEGFGIFTYSFTWAKDENSIYAIAGNNNMQISKCSFTEAGIEMIALVEDDEGEGKIADYGDKLIFADNFAGEFGIIYSIDKTTGQREFLTEGIDFKISPDEANLAVVQQKQVSEESAIVDLKIYSMIDQSETVVVQGGIIESYDFLPSSNMLIYSDGTVSDYTYRFNFGLESYDLNSGAKRSISNMNSGEFDLSKNSSEIYLLDHVMGYDGRFSFTTYRYDIEDDFSN